MTSLVRKVRSVIEQLGSRGAVLYLMDRASRRVGLPLNVRSYWIVAQPVTDLTPTIGRRGQAYTLRGIAEGDAALAQMPLSADTIAFRFGQDARCYGLFRCDELVAYLWLQLGPYAEDEVRGRFVPRPAGKVAWDFDVYVRPQDRMTPAFLVLWNAVNARLAQEGFGVSLSRISAFNRTSLQSHRRLGAYRIGRTDFIGLGPVQVLMSSLRPRFHVALRRTQRPDIVVEVDDQIAGDGATLASSPTRDTERTT